MYIEVRISSQEELDLRTFETISVQYVINESIFRIFVTMFEINFLKFAQLNFQLTFSEVELTKSEVKLTFS